MYNHYKDFTINGATYKPRQLINAFIESCPLPLSATVNLSKALKYAVRCDKKGEYIQDLQKIKVYITFALDNLERLEYKDNELPKNYDYVEYPKHYELNVDGNIIQTIDFINVFCDNFEKDRVVAKELTDVFKYIMRAGKKKNAKIDLQKAIDCVNAALEYIDSKKPKELISTADKVGVLYYEDTE